MLSWCVEMAQEHMAKDFGGALLEKIEKNQIKIRSATDERACVKPEEKEPNRLMRDRKSVV